MIIDADVHISPSLEGGNSIYIEELLKTMEKAGVDQALTWLQPPYMRHIKKSNEYVYKAMRENPDKILGFGWVDPHLGFKEAKDTIAKCIEEYGFYGVKLNGAQNNFYIDDEKMSLPIIEEIAKTKKVLALHVGADAFERTHPFRVEKIAKMFPELSILMVHMGGVGHADLSDAAIEIASRCDNITLIGSAVRTPAIIKAIKILGAHRICFGSDTPFELMHVEVAKYNALLEDTVSVEDKAKIMGGNLLNVLGINK